jgi:hypothetical protein
MAKTLSHYGNPSRSLFKSPNTKPLRDGMCNVPLNCPEDSRSFFDAEKLPNESRNAFLLRMVVAGMKSINPLKGLQLEHILEAHRVAQYCALAFVMFIVSLDFKREDSRTVRVARSSARRRGESKEDYDFHFSEEFHA